MNIAHWLERAATRWPERPALFLGRAQLADYATLAARVRGFAAWLAGQGLRPGDRVGLFMTNTPDYLIAKYGCWHAGMVVVPVNAKLHGAEAAWILHDSGAALCITTPGLDTALRAAGASVPILTGLPEAAPVEARPPVPCDGADLAWLFYTSGTTGRPKGVQITHRMIRTMALNYHLCVDQVSGADCALYAAPLSHGAGLYSVMHMAAGARHVVPASGGFDPAEIFDLAAHHDRVHMFAAPTMIKRMVLAARAQGHDGRGLRSVIYGGGPMYQADIIDAVAQFGPVFIQIYGQGECPMGITSLSREEVADRSHPDWRARLGSVGRAQASVEVRIGDAEGREVAPGTAGEIMVRGDTVMPGYWQNPEATARALRGGWLWTGDVGVMDAQGHVTLQDRSKDMIISGGTNIYPREVEEALLLHPAVQEVAVIGQPDSEWGETVVAFVVCAPDHPLEPSALDAHCLAHIARFKRPKSYHAVTELPKNNYGKVLKTVLRDRLARAAGE